MTPERWSEVKALFTAAMEVAPGAREAHVAAACGDDVQLRDEVLSLVASAAEADRAEASSLPGVRAAIAGEASRAFGGRASRDARDDAELQSSLEAALGQQYEIVRLLGRGGMGAVYLARDRALERFVAVKVLRPDLADVREGRERFRREARIAAHLSHPGILPLHTFGEIGGLWYFVMGYVRGVTLAERLRVEGRIEPDEARRIMTEVADALECAHRSGVIHRDIKPENVLLDDESARAVLADFGIAKVHDAGDSLTYTGAVIGTPSFMSPEQASGAADLDARSDIWSLGAVGYAMLAGREPRAARASGTTHERRDVAPLSEVAPGVPAELAQVVMRALARDPASRWPSARALRDALARSAADSTVEVPDSLRELPTFGPYAVLWAAFWAVLAARPGRSLGDRTLLLFVALIVPIGLVLHVWNVAGDGLTTVELLRVACWPPEWWGMWWPRSLRRPNDLWRRLPRPARATRVAMSAFIVALPAFILAREWVEAKTGRAPALLGEGWFVTLEAVLLAVGAVIVGASLAWAFARGLSFSQSVRVLFGTTSPSPRWREPAMARLLRAPQGARVPPPDNVQEHVRAIEALLAKAKRRSSAGGQQQRDPLASALRVAEAVRTNDAEIATLAKSADTVEVDRLTIRMSALAADAEPTPEHVQLMELLERQLDVVHRMQSRSEELKATRARWMRLLHALWAQLQAADAATGQESDAEGAAAHARLDALLGDRGPAADDQERQAD